MLINILNQRSENLPYLVTEVTQQFDISKLQILILSIAKVLKLYFIIKTALYSRSVLYTIKLEITGGKRKACYT